METMPRTIPSRASTHVGTILWPFIKAFSHSPQKRNHEVSFPGQLLFTELQQRGDVHCCGFPDNGLIHSPVIMGDQISHSLHRAPLDTVRGCLTVLSRQSAAQFPNLQDGKADRPVEIRIRRIDLKGISIAFNGLSNGDTILFDVLNSLQIRRHHSASPFPV